MNKQYLINLELTTDPDGLQENEIRNRVTDSLRWLGFVDSIEICDVSEVREPRDTVPDSTGYSG